MHTYLPLEFSVLQCNMSGSVFVGLDKFLVGIGEFGRYQRFHYMLLAMTGFIGCFSAMAYVFVAAVPDHWCAAPVEFANFSMDDRKQLTIPLEETGTFSRCLIFNLSSISYILVHDDNSSGSRNYTLANSKISTEECTQWEYDTSVFTYTAVTEWNLVCGKEWIAASVGASMGIGKLVFGAIGGVLADRFGRKKILVLMTSIQAVVGILTAFSPHPIVFAAGCGIISGSSLAAYQSAFIIGVEMVGVKWRVFAGLGIYVAWSFGYLTLALIAYFVRVWSTLQLVLHVPILVFVFLYAWFTPESVRWLLQNDREDEAIAIMKNMTKVNKKEWTDGYVAMIQSSTTEATKQQEVMRFEGHERRKVNLISLLKSRMMLRFTLCSCFLWFSCNLLFYGLSYNTASLVGDPYVNFAISGAAELPAFLCVYFLLKSRLGRRGTTFASLLTASLALLLTMAIPKELGVITTVLAMVGKFSSTAAFATMFIYTPEFYPTTFRSIGIGTSSFIGRVGVIIAPYIAILGKVYYSGLPLIVFGVASLTAAALSLLLPETRLVHLPDTKADLKRLKRHTLLYRNCANRKNASEDLGEENEELNLTMSKTVTSDKQ